MRSRLASLICGGVIAAGLSYAAWPSFAQISLSDQPPPKGAAPLPGKQAQRLPRPPGPPVGGIDPATVQDLTAARFYRPPAGIGFKHTDFFSENTRLTAQWFYASSNEGKKLPTVIMAHGWGATAANFREDAIDLAKAGYLVMLFDYRGWGESDGRVALTGQKPVAGAVFTAEARQLRGYIDPWEQVEDWYNAISYAATDPMVDAARIGIRGTDLSGGHVLQVAAHDPRVKALVSQVTIADARPTAPHQPEPEKLIAQAHILDSRIAAGQAQYPEDRTGFAAGVMAPPVGGVATRVGAPVGAKLARYAPVRLADLIEAPALFVLAEDEEMLDNATNGGAACDNVSGPRRLLMIPKLLHYGIYGPARQTAIAAAVEWFDKYLKPTTPPARSEDEDRDFCLPEAPPPQGDEDVTGSGDRFKVQDASGRWN